MLESNFRIQIEDDVTTANPFVSDQKWSLRHAAVAALPVAVGIWVLAAMLGGLHGGGKPMWVAALWPMIVLAPFIGESDGPLPWVVFLDPDRLAIGLWMARARRDSGRPCAAVQ